MTKVKICGITNLDDALAACEAGADALGFVFASEAKARNRYIDPEKAHGICDQLPPFVMKVAVCVNAPLPRVIEYLEFMDRVQLCGEETIEEYVSIASRAIKVVHVAPTTKLKIPHPKCQFAACLLDTSVAGAHGGMYISHLRSEGRHLLEAIDEAIAIARAANVPTEIYHLKAAGRANWGKLDAATARGAWRIVARSTWIWLAVIALLVLAGSAS